MKIGHLKLTVCCKTQAAILLLRAATLSSDVEKWSDSLFKTHSAN